MNGNQRCDVAVLLSTYNGSNYVEQQLKSLKDNTTEFTLHWLDDHSVDGTREVVRECARDLCIAVREWHHSEHLGVPGSFFHLLLCVEADLYLFCDQDDIWFPGKIDSTVASLLDDLAVPSLSFTDTVIFDDSRPGVLCSPYDFSPTGRLARAIRDQVTFAFLPGGPSAQTQGFTKPLRDLFLKHRSTACAYAAMHDWWMYDIAIATGRVHLLSDAPKVLYRKHEGSFCACVFGSRKGEPISDWRRNQVLRKFVSRHSKGLILASETLPKGPSLDRMLHCARLAASIDRRQSLTDVVRLSRLGFMPYVKSMAWSCMFSDA